MHVYILIANEEEKVKECIVVTELDTAMVLFEALKKVWGGASVALVSRKINDIPENVQCSQ